MSSLHQSQDSEDNLRKNFSLLDVEIIPNSLDMPPIENIWTVLGDKLVEIKSQPSNIQSLKES